MAKFLLRTVNIIFHILCIAALLFLVCGSLKRYHNNKSSLNEDFRRFQTNGSSVYPSISMCFTSPFLGRKLEKLVTGLTPSHYSDFIIGRTNYSSILAGISYQDVSLNVKDFVISATFSSKTKEVSEQSTSLIDSITYTDLSFYVWRFLRCFTFNVPYDEDVIVNELVIELNRTVFPNNVRPMSGWAKEHGLSMLYHLPNQLFKSYTTRKIVWPKELLQPYSTYSYVENIEILKRRHVTKDSCTDVENYDEHFKELVVSSVGCYPPYGKANLDAPMCDSKEKLMKVSEKMWDRFYGKVFTAPPCTTIQRIDVEYLDSEPWDEDTSTADSLYFPIFFRDITYKNVVQVRDYSHSDLGGDVGGYLGLLLGYALVQVPNLIWKLFAFLTSEEKSFRKTIRNCFSKNKENEIHEIV